MQDGKPLDGTWRPDYNAKLISISFLRAHELTRTFLLVRFDVVDLNI